MAQLTELAKTLKLVLGNANVKAFLHVIREGESYQDDNRAYYVRWGGTGNPPKFFTSLAKHPRIFEPGPRGPSSAAGAYQITATTYDDFALRLGVDDFSKETQDLLAVAIIHYEGALDDIVSGRLAEAVSKLGGRWASLPSNTDGQRTVKYAKLQDVFLRYGGRLSDQQGLDLGIDTAPIEATQPEPGPAPIIDISPPIQEEKPKMAFPIAIAASILIPLAEALLPYIKTFGSGSLTSTRNLKMTEALARKVLDVAKTVVPSATNEQDVVEQIKGSTELQKQFTMATALKADEIEPLIQLALQLEQVERENMDSAAERYGKAEVNFNKPTVFVMVAIGQFILTIIVLIAMGVGVSYVITKTADLAALGKAFPDIPSWVATIIGGLFVAVALEWRSILQTVTGTTQGSNAKNAIIDKLADKIK